LHVSLKLEINIQFASLSEFDTEHTNFLNLGVSHPFSSISVFLIFFLNTGPWERQECPYLILNGMDRSETSPVGLSPFSSILLAPFPVLLCHARHEIFPGAGVFQPDRRQAN